MRAGSKETFRSGAGDQFTRSGDGECAASLQSVVGITRLSQHLSANRLSYQEYATYYLKYKDQPFTLYQGADGTWSDRNPAVPCRIRRRGSSLLWQNTWIRED